MQAEQVLLCSAWLSRTEQNRKGQAGWLLQPAPLGCPGFGWAQNTLSLLIKHRTCAALAHCQAGSRLGQQLARHQGHVGPHVHPQPVLWLQGQAVDLAPVHALRAAHLQPGCVSHRTASRASSTSPAWKGAAAAAAQAALHSKAAAHPGVQAEVEAAAQHGDAQVVQHARQGLAHALARPRAEGQEPLHRAPRLGLCAPASRLGRHELGAGLLPALLHGIAAGWSRCNKPPVMQWPVREEPTLQARGTLHGCRFVTDPESPVLLPQSTSGTGAFAAHASQANRAWCSGCPSLYCRQKQSAHRQEVVSVGAEVGRQPMSGVEGADKQAALGHQVPAQLQVSCRPPGCA